MAPGVGFLAGAILAIATSPRAVYVAAGATALTLALGAVLMLRAAAALGGEGVVSPVPATA